MNDTENVSVQMDGNMIILTQGNDKIVMSIFELEAVTKELVDMAFEACQSEVKH